MAAAKKKTEAEKTNSATRKIQRIAVTLRGMPGSPLVIHQFSEKAKQEIRDKQQKKARNAKDERKPREEFLAARYLGFFNGEERECAPVTALKKCLISAGTAMDDLTKVALRQALFVSPAIDPASMLVPILTHDGKPAIGRMREDAVTIGGTTRGLAYRPEYPEWQLEIVIEYQPHLVSRDQLLALIDHAGWGVGICEGRPEKTSALGWGRFVRSHEEDLESPAPLGERVAAAE